MKPSAFSCQRSVRIVLGLVAGMLVASGCHESDIDPMMRQEKFKAYWEDHFFPDDRAMRMPVEGTVPRERVLDTATSPPVTNALLVRGHDRFDIYCAVCHGYAGDGDSVVASKMSLRAPPPFVSGKLLAYTPAQIFEVETNGYGYMPRYNAQLSVHDRWAIAHYIKALQLSQHASVDDVPADKRGELEAKPAANPERKE